MSLLVSLWLPDGGVAQPAATAAKDRNIMATQMAIKECDRPRLIDRYIANAMTARDIAHTNRVMGDKQSFKWWMQSAIRTIRLAKLARTRGWSA
jgi:hypothetical protein